MKKIISVDQFVANPTKYIRAWLIFQYTTGPNIIRTTEASSRDNWCRENFGCGYAATRASINATGPMTGPTFLRICKAQKLNMPSVADIMTFAEQQGVRTTLSAELKLTRTNTLVDNPNATLALLAYVKTLNWLKQATTSPFNDAIPICHKHFCQHNS